MIEKIETAENFDEFDNNQANEVTYKSPLIRKYIESTISVTYKSPLIRKQFEKIVLQESSTNNSIIEISKPLFTMRDDLALILYNTDNLYQLDQKYHFSFFKVE